MQMSDRIARNQQPGRITWFDWSLRYPLARQHVVKIRQLHTTMLRTTAQPAPPTSSFITFESLTQQSDALTPINRKESRW